METEKCVKTIIGRKRRFQDYNKLPLKAGEKLEELDQYRKSELYRERATENAHAKRQGINSPIQGLRQT